MIIIFGSWHLSTIRSQSFPLIVAKADSLDAIETRTTVAIGSYDTRLAEANIQYFDFEEVGPQRGYWLNVPFDPQAFTNLGFVMAAAAAGGSAIQEEGGELPAPVRRPMVRNVFGGDFESSSVHTCGELQRPTIKRHSDTMRLHTALFGSLGRLADKMDEIHEQWRDKRNNRQCRFWTILCRLESVTFVLILLAAAVVILGVELTGTGNSEEGLHWKLFEYDWIKSDDVACFTNSILAQDSS